MITPSRGPAHRSTRRRRVPAAVLPLVLVLWGCAGPQLHQFNQHANRHDHQWIAAQEIRCRQASHRCGQLHLIKASACLHLGESGNAPIVDFTCAADHFETAIALKTTWKDAGRRLDVQEKLCRSLDRLQRLQTGSAAEQTLDRLVAAAQALYQLSPQSVAAVYYLSRARLSQTAPLLHDAGLADQKVGCIRLERTLTQVLLMIGRAKTNALPDWSRFGAKYERLAFELGTTLRAGGCR